MTEQYKNPFEDPNAELWGEKIKDYKIPKRRKVPLEGRVATIPGYIYVPKIKLYVAKEKSLYGLNWYQAHKELHKKSMQMLTPRQFIDFVLYLKQNKSNIPEAEKILDGILMDGNPWKREWLDAKFNEKTRGGIPIKAMSYLGGSSFYWPTDEPIYEKAGKLYIRYNHITVKGKLVAQNTELLKKCLMKDCTINFKRCNKQGLPTKKGKDIGYWSPKGGFVAGFAKEGSVGEACLNCRLDIEYDEIGVRPARKK